MSTVEMVDGEEPDIDHAPGSIEEMRVNVIELMRACVQKNDAREAAYREAVEAAVTVSRALDELTKAEAREQKKP